MEMVPNIKAFSSSGSITPLAFRVNCGWKCRLSPLIDTSSCEVLTNPLNTIFSGFLAFLPTGPLKVIWSRDLDEESDDTFETQDATAYGSGEVKVTTESPTPKTIPAEVNKYKDFIKCLPIHLSKRILGKDHSVTCPTAP